MLARASFDLRFAPAARAVHGFLSPMVCRNGKFLPNDMAINMSP